MAAVIADVLAHRAAAVRRNVLKRCGFGSSSRNDDRIIHRAGLPQPVHHLSHRRALLADGDVNASYVSASLVDDRIDRYRRLSRLPIADDQLALPAPGWNHAVG